MAGEQYAERAVDAVLDYYEGALQTHLTAVETALSLSAGTLAPPVDYVQADLPTDNRVPLLEVWAGGGAPVDAVNGLWAFDVSVVLTHSGDADAEGGQLRARRYLSAMIRAVRADRTLGGSVMAAIETAASLDGVRGDQSLTRHVAALDLRVLLQET